MSGHGAAQVMTATKSGPLKGRAEIPGDKSISHRALIFGAMTVGETRITGLLEGEDVLDTASAMRAFGAEVVQHGAGTWSVHGVGVGGFREPENVIDFGNSLRRCDLAITSNSDYVPLWQRSLWCWWSTLSAS